MTVPDLRLVPEQHRDAVRAALLGALGPSGATSVTHVGGGASGALTYRVGADTGDLLLRVETITGPMRNPVQYDCMQIAADAGIAPAVRWLDAAAGIVMMPFIIQQPLADYAGGPEALATDAGSLLARLHQTTTFPSRGDHLANLAGLMAHLALSGRVAPHLLDAHAAAFERIRQAYPWQPETFVSTHNDPNQLNVLYDGERLWLIDWETASRNDPMLDVATAAGHLATTPELLDLLLRSWLGRAPDEVERAQVTVMGWLVSLFVGCILLEIVPDPDHPTHTDLTAMTPDAFTAGIVAGSLRAGEPRTTLAFAKMALASFGSVATTRFFDDTLAVFAAG